MSPPRRGRRKQAANRDDGDSSQSCLTSRSSEDDVIGELPCKPQAELDALLEQAAEEEEPAAALNGDALKKLIDPGD